MSGNYLLGGNYAILPALTGSQDNGTFSNVNITGNYTGFTVDGEIYTGGVAGVKASDNTAFDWSNAIWSTDAWQTYLADGIETQHLISATAQTPSISASATGSTTLYGAGINGAHLFGGKNETVFIGGAGPHNYAVAASDNIYLSRAIGFVPTTQDAIGNFDVNKDVIDLSAISGNFSVAGSPREFDVHRNRRFHRFGRAGALSV